MLYLHRRGGLWFDSDMQPLNLSRCTRYDRLAPTVPLVLFDFPKENAPRGSLIAASPGSPIIERTLRKIAANLRQPKVPRALDATGPRVLQRTLCKFVDIASCKVRGLTRGGLRFGHIYGENRGRFLYTSCDWYEHRLPFHKNTLWKSMGVKHWGAYSTA